MNKKFYLQGKDLKDEIVSRFNNVWFEWNITYHCNFRCPYCFFDGKWEEYGPRTVFKSPEEWVKLWKKIEDMYGEVFLVVSGGEPFTYPDFADLVAAVSKMHYMNISTNASGNLDEFIEKVNPERVSLTLAFHPEFTQLPDIIQKTKSLKKAGFRIDYINLCAWPPYISQLDKYIETASKAGIMLKVIPFCGQYDNRDYPDSYTDEEREVLGMDSSWEESVSRKGTLCMAGYRTALIYPDGKVARCGQMGEDYLIGNFFDDDFSLLNEPLPCGADLCPCLEAPPAEESET